MHPHISFCGTQSTSSIQENHPLAFLDQLSDCWMKDTHFMQALWIQYLLKQKNYTMIFYYFPQKI